MPCDPQGRFWAGTKAHDNRAGGGALYRLDRNGPTELMLDGLTISNGLGWSPDGGTMYLADTIPRVIHEFSFDGERGTISDGRVLVTVTEGVGPDGLTVDAAGDMGRGLRGRTDPPLFRGGQAGRGAARPCGADDVVCLGGPGLTRLYVTTATEDWSDAQRCAEPAAGLTYRFDTDATGRPAAPFRPQPTWWNAVTS